MLLLLLSRSSRVWLCATPLTAAHQAPPTLGFSRQEHWSVLPFPSPKLESEKWNWRRSVVSDSSHPHGLQPTRLLHPWHVPGKSTGVGCHCLLWYQMLGSIILDSHPMLGEATIQGKVTGFPKWDRTESSSLLPYGEQQKQGVSFLFALWDTAACLLVSSELDARPLECARSPLGRKPLGFRAVRVPYLQSGSFPSHNPDSCSFSKEESLFWPFDMCSVTYDSS